MDSMDNFRERIEALEQQMKVIGAHTRMVERRLRWWRITWSVAAVMALGLALALPLAVQAKTFQCGAGDVQCLIDAINEANANGEKNTIRLEAGTYTLTAVDNDTNGLPSITSTLTIKGDGADTTILERDSSAPSFRLVHVATSGNLTLTGVTLRGGGNAPRFNFVSGSGLFNNGGVVTITQSTFAQNQGGLFTNGGTVRITQSSFIGNSAGPGITGGLHATGGTVTITQSTFAQNNSGFAGGIAIDHPAVVTVVNSTVADNSVGGIGGGILNEGGVLLITNSTITRNRA